MMNNVEFINGSYWVTAEANGFALWCITEKNGQDGNNYTDIQLVEYFQGADEAKYKAIKLACLNGGTAK